MDNRQERALELLAEINNDPTRSGQFKASDLVQELNLDPQTAGWLYRQLEEHGYIKRWHENNRAIIWEIVELPRIATDGGVEIETGSPTNRMLGGRKQFATAARDIDDPKLAAEAWDVAERAEVVICQLEDAESIGEVLTDAE